MTQLLYIPVHSNTRPHQSCVDCTCRRPSQSFEQSNICSYSSSAFRFSLDSNCICTKSNLNVFCSRRYTGSVSISIETSEKSKIRIYSEHSGHRNRLHVTCPKTASSVRTLQYLARTKYGAVCIQICACTKGN